MKLLITGGAGFIGANFIYYMLENFPDYTIVCLDKLTYAGCLRTLDKARANARFTFVQGDIADRQTVFPLFEKEAFDVVVNFAAESHVDRSIREPGVFIATNVVGTHVLLEASVAYKIRRFHQISTDEVYGDLPLDRQDLLFTEKTPLHASSPYSASKASADLLTLAYYRTYGLNVTVSRCSNNYGPFQFPEKLIPLMFINALNDKRLPVYGEGKNIRDWLYVGDHCTAIDAILHRGNPGEVYNIGGHNERANIDVVKTILRLLDKPDSLIEHVRDRAGHDLRYAIDASKINAELGWSSSTAFESGLRDTVDWYLHNIEWWQPLYERMFNDDDRIH